MRKQVVVETSAPAEQKQQPKCGVSWCIALADGVGDKCTVHRDDPEFRPREFKGDAWADV